MCLDVRKLFDVVAWMANIAEASFSSARDLNAITSTCKTNSKALELRNNRFIQTTKGSRIIGIWTSAIYWAIDQEKHSALKNVEGHGLRESFE